MSSANAKESLYGLSFLLSNILFISLLLKSILIRFTK